MDLKDKHRKTGMWCGIYEIRGRSRTSGISTLLGHWMVEEEENALVQLYFKSRHLQLMYSYVFCGIRLYIASE